MPGSERIGPCLSCHRTNRSFLATLRQCPVCPLPDLLGNETMSGPQTIVNHCQDVALPTCMQVAFLQHRPHIEAPR